LSENDAFISAKEKIILWQQPIKNLQPPPSTKETKKSAEEPNLDADAYDTDDSLPDLVDISSEETDSPPKESVRTTPPPTR
jgi:hypothetical protein